MTGYSWYNLCSFSVLFSAYFSSIWESYTLIQTISETYIVLTVVRNGEVRDVNIILCFDNYIKCKVRKTYCYPILQGLQCTPCYSIHAMYPMLPNPFRLVLFNKKQFIVSGGYKPLTVPFSMFSTNIAKI